MSAHNPHFNPAVKLSTPRIPYPRLSNLSIPEDSFEQWLDLDKHSGGMS